MPWPPPGLHDRRLREQAERLIETSGDGSAIRTLGLLRRDPQTWVDTVRRQIGQSTVLKLALGVFLGVIAAEAVANLLSGEEAHELARHVDRALVDVSDNETPGEADTDQAFETESVWPNHAASDKDSTEIDEILSETDSTESDLLDDLDLIDLL